MCYRWARHWAGGGEGGVCRPGQLSDPNEDELQWVVATHEDQAGGTVIVGAVDKGDAEFLVDCNTPCL
jgi:hypothetical protein